MTYMRFNFYQNDAKLIGVYETESEAVRRVSERFPSTSPCVTSCPDIVLSCVTCDKSKRVWVKKIAYGEYDFPEL